MSKLSVAKFGGTSVANFESMSLCANIVIQDPNTRIVVLSASAGVTNYLVELANGCEKHVEMKSLLPFAPFNTISSKNYNTKQKFQLKLMNY